MKKWFFIAAGAAAVLVLAGYAGMNMAASYVLNSLVPSSTKSESPAAYGTQQEQPAKQPEASAPPVSTEKSSASTAEAPQTAASQEAAPAEKEKENKPAPAVGQDQAAKTQETAPSLPAAASSEQKFNYEAEVSADKAKAVENSISTKEKAQVLSVLLKKLSASDIQLFMKMAGTGMSVEEKKEAKKIILQKLTEDEYNQLIAIAAKYGLSKGKSYADSMKENLNSK